MQKGKFERAKPYSGIRTVGHIGRSSGVLAAALALQLNTQGQSAAVQPKDSGSSKKPG